MSHGIEEYAAPSSESMAGPKQRQLVILFAGKLFGFFFVIFFDLMLAEEKLVRDHIYSILASLYCWKDLSYQDSPCCGTSSLSWLQTSLFEKAYSQKLYIS